MIGFILCMALGIYLAGDGKMHNKNHPLSVQQQQAQKDNGGYRHYGLYNFEQHAPVVKETSGQDAQDNVPNVPKGRQ